MRIQTNFTLSDNKTFQKTLILEKRIIKLLLTFHLES